MITLDWGSTRLRAYRNKESRSADVGVFNVPNREFEKTLRDLIGDWLTPEAKLIAAGMIGSANGWDEAPYVRAPATRDALRENAIEIPFTGSNHTLKIVPGVRVGEGATTDVMRGEETQIFGVLGDARDGIFCLPGTHCKWVIVERDAIVDFRTHYTGELFQWLSTQSSVSKVLENTAAFDAEAFDAAAQRAFDGPHDLLNQLFQLRASVVSRECTGAQSASAAQGVVIGNDCANGLQYLRRKLGEISSNSKKFEDKNVHIVGSVGLTKLYARVLASHGVTTVEHDADVTVKGLQHIFGEEG